jgi:hypothetical protein
MKPSDFEQKFTAWLDGHLNAAEAEAFEREMKERGFDPAAERDQATRLASLLQTHSTSPEMTNGDFFNHQLRHRVAQESTPASRSSSSWWSWPRLVLAGACSLAIAGALFTALIPHGTAPDLAPYYATVVDARTFDPKVSASTVYDPRSNVTVLWLDGLDYLPADYAIQ